MRNARSSLRSSLARVLALAAVVALAASACTSTPALSDPKEILVKAVDATTSAKSVHLEATVGGSVNIDLTGSGSPSALALDGTSLGGDIDIANSNAHLTIKVPALLGLTADVIQIGQDSYAKTSLSGDKYQHSKASTSTLPIDPSDPKKALEDFKTWLDKPEVSPSKGADTTCDGTSCYQVSIELTAAELASLGASASPSPGASASSTMDPSSKVTLTFAVRKDNTHLSSIKATVNLGAQGTLDVQLTFTKWDASVTITAPPADQVTESSPSP